MSIVGPRPLLPFFAEPGDKDKVEKRLSVPAGITGWWQVKNREHNTSLHDMIDYDLHYVENASVNDVGHMDSLPYAALRDRCTRGSLIVRPNDCAATCEDERQFVARDCLSVLSALECLSVLLRKMGEMRAE